MAKRPEFRHLTIGVSLFEIYGGKLFDLIHGRKLIKCLEDSRGKVCYPGLTEHPVSGPDRLMELIEEGARNRSTGTTSRNADSSRSHAVLQLNLRKNIGRKKNVEHGTY
jgi:kinesin family protein 2/24